MRCATFSSNEHAHGSFGARRQTTVSRLAVDQVTTLTREWMFVCRLRANTAQLFVNRKQHTNVVHAFSAQTFGCKDLRGDDTLSVTRTAPVNKLFVFTRFNKRRHRVHVRRKHNARRLTRGRDHVETIVVHFLSLNMITKLFSEKLRQILAHLQLFASQRRNINQLTR